MQRSAWTGLGDATPPAVGAFYPVFSSLGVTPPAPSVGPMSDGPNDESAIPGFLNSGSLDAGNPMADDVTTFAANISPTTQALLIGGAGLLLLLLVMPSPPSSGSRRR